MSLGRAATIESCNFRFLQELVYTESGIVLGDDKGYLFESRLSPIVRQLGLTSIDELCSRLMSSREREIGRQVVEAMTTNETYFYRDPAHYDIIRSTLLPQLRQEHQKTKKLRFWSAASSTGQEAYSLAMLLAEQGLKDWSIDILATDYTLKVLETARAGRYQQIEVNRGLPASMLLRHFHRVGLSWQLNDNIRRMVRFEQIDLRNSMCALGPFDLVFCRNVLIYFDATTRRQIMQEIHGTLYRGGWLLLGGAEHPGEISDLFDKQTIGNATVHISR